MPSTAEQVVLAFMEGWRTSFDGVVAGFRRYMAPNSSWQQPGFPTTTTLEESVNLLNSAYVSHGIATIDTTLRHIVANETTVMAERVDKVLSPEGKLISTLDVTGVFEVNTHGQITAWREYFDPTPLIALAQKT